MANIQPFDYQKSTNIEEHNQIVNKVNEIVQVINNVNLDTINSEIANLKANATATDTEITNIKNKDTQQDTEIDSITKSLVSNVTANFDNPSRELKISLGREASPSIEATVVIPASSETGQYSAGNGITIDNYQIAVDTGVVALKTDIPVVPDVSEITNRLDTIDGEITGINADITNITNKNTEQDTAINGKVAIAQGVENSGKVLGIGPDGNVTPVNAGGSSGGGEVWEEVDLNNWPTDWSIDDRLKVAFKLTTDSTSPFVNSSALPNQIIEMVVPSLTDNFTKGIPLITDDFSEQHAQVRINIVWFSNFNVSGDFLFRAQGYYNGKNGILAINKSNLSTYVYKIWRLKKN